MRKDFSEVQDGESYVSIPEGVYLCRIDEVRTGFSRDGSSERWSLKLVVDEGEFAGRVAAWDNLNWSERGVLRVKRVLEAFGYDVSGVLELEADDLRGKRIQAQVQVEVWEDERTGNRSERMVVPYLGYGPAQEVVPNGAAGGLAAGPF